MSNPRVLVFAGYGLNCEEETKFAFDTAGAAADIVHINDLIEKPTVLNRYQILAFPGGFAYGDDTGSGNAYANKLKNSIWNEINKFVQKDKLVIGICNGFQIIVNLGLLPALEWNYGTPQVALLHNESARYTVRWVDLQIQNDTPWLKHIEKLMVPVAHGEGRFYAAGSSDLGLYASAETLQQLKKKKLIALKYVEGEICKHHRLFHNPNGALEDIAGITDESGRILGLMPHPERAMFFTQLPHWTWLKEQYKRKGKRIPQYGPGLQIFKNAVRYFS